MDTNGAVFAEEEEEDGDVGVTSEPSAAVAVDSQGGEGEAVKQECLIGPEGRVAGDEFVAVVKEALFDWARGEEDMVWYLQQMLLR